MKLYVDDLRECPEGWQLARTVTEAVRILATQHVTEISLDHDICHATSAQNGVYQPIACPETFEPVAWFIKFMPIGMTPVVHVHTANPAGEKKIKEILGL